MRWTSSLFLMAPPRKLAASFNSFASLSAMPFSGRDAGVGNEPAHRQRRTPVLRHFDRHLIVGAAHAPRLHFEQRLGVLHGLLESLQRIVAGALAQLLHGFVEDTLRGVLLALPHHGVHELLHQGGVVHRIRRYLTNYGSSSAWHTFLRFRMLLTDLGVVVVMNAQPEAPPLAGHWQCELAAQPDVGGFPFGADYRPRCPMSAEARHAGGPAAGLEIGLEPAVRRACRRVRPEYRLGFGAWNHHGDLWQFREAAPSWRPCICRARPICARMFPCSRTSGKENAPTTGRACMATSVAVLVQ